MDNTFFFFVVLGNLFVMLLLSMVNVLLVPLKYLIMYLLPISECTLAMPINALRAYQERSHPYTLVCTCTTLHLHEWQLHNN